MERTASQRDAELKAKYNPEGSQLRQIQLRELAILVEFDRVCREHGIDYWLDSGTLIGAVRHGGFIPWDDDIDVCVLKKDHKKLRNAMIESLNTDYEYLEMGSDTNYEYPRLGKKAKRIISRLYDKHAAIKRPLRNSSIIINDNLWIDVFFMEPGTLVSKKIIENTYGKCLRRVWNIVDDGIVKHYLAVFAYPFTVLFKYFVNCWCAFFHQNTLVSCGNTFFYIRKKTDIFPLGEIEFEGLKFKAPRDADSYLKRIYGNYMEIPPEDKIEDHCILEYKVDTQPREECMTFHKI